MLERVQIIVEAYCVFIEAHQYAHVVESGTPDALPRTLVIHGTLDPNTSYTGAQAHVATLAKAGPVAMTTVERGAHMLAFFAPACFVAATTAFLDDAAVAPSCSEPDPAQQANALR